MRVHVPVRLDSIRNGVAAHADQLHLTGHGIDEGDALDYLRRGVLAWCHGLQARGELDRALKVNRLKWEPAGGGVVTVVLEVEPDTSQDHQMCDQGDVANTGDCEMDMPGPPLQIPAGTPIRVRLRRQDQDEERMTLSSDTAGYITLELYWVTCLVCERREQVYDNIHLDGTRAVVVPGWTNAGRGRWHCPDCAHLVGVVAKDRGVLTDAETL